MNFDYDSETKEYICSYCGKRYSQYDSLSKHYQRTNDINIMNYHIYDSDIVQKVEDYQKNQRNITITKAIIELLEKGLKYDEDTGKLKKEQVVIHPILPIFYR